MDLNYERPDKFEQMYPKLEEQLTEYIKIITNSQVKLNNLFNGQKI